MGLFLIKMKKEFEAFEVTITFDVLKEDLTAKKIKEAIKQIEFMGLVYPYNLKVKVNE